MARPNAQRFNYKAKPERVEIVTEGIEGTPAVELPFILGVMSDLSGANNSELPDVEDRNFYEGLDADTFDEFLKSQKPKVEFTVPSTINDEKDLAVSLEFEKIDDFLPDAVAARVDGLKEILALRNELENLKTYASKAKVRKLLEKLAKNEDLAKEFAATISSGE